jgi:hypothetical protein
MAHNGQALSSFYPMNLRTVAILIAVLFGLVAGPAAIHTLLPTMPHGDVAIPWLTLFMGYVACAIGLPLVLVSLASSGNYQAMVRAWSVFGLIGIWCVAAGVSDVLHSPGRSTTESHALVLMAVGLGLLSGLGLVKLSIRRNRAASGA